MIIDVLITGVGGGCAAYANILAIICKLGDDEISSSQLIDTVAELIEINQMS